MLTPKKRNGLIAAVVTLGLSGGLGLMATGANAAAAPDGIAISSLNVTKGSTAGGTAVLITGTGFTKLNTPKVKFDVDGSAAAQYGSPLIVLSDTQIATVAPSHAAGKIDVTLSDGTTDYDAPAGSTKDDFTYLTPYDATVAANSLMSSLGGSALTVTSSADMGACGTAFAANVVTATIGGVSAPVTCVDSMHVSLLVPAGTPSATASKVVLFHNGVAGAADATHAKYASVISGIDKPVGPVGGGGTVVVTGKGFTNGGTWKFGTEAATCTPVTGATDTKVSCVVPPAAGWAAATGTPDPASYNGSVSVNFVPAAGPYGVTSKAAYTYSDLG